MGRALARAALAAALVGATTASADDRAWWVPDQAKLQLAGNIGFLSPGVGWAGAGHRLEGDLFFGWVPHAVGGEDIYALTAKVTWQPWGIAIARRGLLRPFSVALQLTYTFGRKYFVVLPDRYPSGYYDFSSALRSGIALGGSLAVRTRGAIREVGLYWEAVALDVMLVSWARNTRALGPRDVFTLALGVRATF